MTKPVRVPAIARDAVAEVPARLLPYSLRRIWSPEVYQGGARRNGYFEGWYLKCVDGAREHPVAFIPGVSHDANGGTSHSFVQVVRPGGKTSYLEYPLDAFSFDQQRFEVRVGPNVFSAAGAVLDIDRDGVEVRGSLRFGPWRPWPVTLLQPGIMGPYRFVPRMECSHGVVSLDHAVDGTLTIDGAQVVYDGGRGYAEKDWGSSFPSSWVWAQSNHFSVPGVSVTVSTAKIPWMGSSFVGCIAGVLLGDELYRFTTYTGAKLIASDTSPGSARLTFADKHHTLETEVDGAVPSALKAPRHGQMIARADESLDATIRARLTRNRDGAVLLDDIGLHAGVEVMDSRGELAATRPYRSADSGHCPR